MTLPDRPAQQSATLDAQAALASAEASLAAHRAAVAALHASWAEADALAVEKAETTKSKEYRAAQELAEELRLQERRTARLEGDVASAKDALHAATLADALTGATLLGQAQSRRDQQLQLDAEELLASWAAKLAEYGEGQRAWEEESAYVESLGGPSPRPEFKLAVPHLVVYGPAVRGLGQPVDVGATLAALIKWLQDAPQRAADERASAERRRLELARLLREENLRGANGEPARDAELALVRAEDRRFHPGASAGF
jgi:hypothetical protein